MPITRRKGKPGTEFFAEHDPKCSIDADEKETYSSKRSKRLKQASDSRKKKVEDITQEHDINSNCLSTPDISSKSLFDTKSHTNTLNDIHLNFKSRKHKYSLNCHRPFEWDSQSLLHYLHQSRLGFTEFHQGSKVNSTELSY